MGTSWSSLVSSYPPHRRAFFWGSACLGGAGLIWLWRDYQRRSQECLTKGPVKYERAQLPLSIDNAGSISDIYEIDSRTMAEGSYGKVRKAVKKDTGETVAVKEIMKSQPLRISSEIDIMKRLDHPNIIKLIETYQNSRCVFLVMELAVGGELFDRVIDAGHFTEAQSAHCMRQIVRAIQYCHQQNICYRSVKPEDVLCMTKAPIHEVVLKLTDFGLSTTLFPGEFLETKAGTPYYVAPQVLAGKYDFSCDLWSCGVVMYVLLCGYPPFFGETDADVLAKVRLGNYSFIAADWKNVSEDAKNLIRNLLKMNPRDRYSANQALQSPWMASGLPKMVLSVQKEVLDSGGFEIALMSLGGNEAARFTYDTDPTLDVLRVDAASKLDIIPGQVDFL